VRGLAPALRPPVPGCASAPRILAGVATFLRTFLQFLVVALDFVILGRVIFSWFDPRYSSPIGRFLYSVTEPLLGPIRRFLPSTGTLDLSPIILFLGLGFVAGALGLR
jgi:YggT family protein